MKNKILIVLPYKESLNPNKAGAVSLFVTDTKKYSKFKKNIKIFSSETKSKNMLFTNKNYINNFCLLHKNTKIDLFEIHNRPEYVYYIKKHFPNSKITLTFHNDPLNLRNSKSVSERNYLIQTCSKIIFVSLLHTYRFYT